MSELPGEDFAYCIGKSFKFEVFYLEYQSFKTRVIPWTNPANLDGSRGLTCDFIKFLYACPVSCRLCKVKRRLERRKHVSRQPTGYNSTNQFPEKVSTKD